jgi:hypothetical protein
MRDRHESQCSHESLDVVEQVKQHERVEPVKSLDFQREMSRGAPLHHPNRARRAALRLTTTRVTRAPASRATLGPECTGE